MGNKALVPLELYTSGSNPTVPTPAEGAIYYNSTSDEIRAYNGSTWVAIGGGGGTPASTVTTLTGLQSAVVGTATNYAREDHSHGIASLVTTDTTQNVGGAKTFTSDVVVSTGDGQVTIGGAYFNMYGSGSFSGVTYSSSVVGNNFRLRADPPDATSGTPLRDSYIELYNKYWNGASSLAEYLTLKSVRVSASNNSYEFRVAMEGTDRLVLSSDGILSTSSYYLAPAATTSIPSIRLPHGTAPSAPTNGDVWTTTAGMFVRVNGSTVPLGSADTTPLIFTFPGQTAAQTGRLRQYVEGSFTIVAVRASANTAPTGASLICDVNKNGTTIYTTQGNRPTIAVSTNTATANSPDVTTLTSGDYLTVDVDQIGSTVPGADVVVQVWVRRT